MKKLRVVMIILILVGLTGCKPWTIVKNEEIADDGSIKIYFETDDFDVTAYTKDIWDNQLFEYYNERKIKGEVLIEALKGNEAEAGAKYGLGSNEIGSSWTFIIDGKGEILEVNTESKAGIMLVDLEPCDGIADMALQIGPVIKGSTIRDTLDFIKLDDFSNQVEFASISKAFNSCMISEAIGMRDYTHDVGKEMTFLGSFTYSDTENILVSPIQLNIEEGN